MEIESILDIGSFIKASRLEYGLTQSQVAFATKVERSLINRLENGKVEGIKLKTLNKIVKGLNAKLVIRTRESDRDRKYLTL